MAQNKDQDPLSDLSLKLRFKSLANFLERALDDKLLPLNISGNEWTALHAIAQAGSIMPSTLAQKLGMSRSGMSRLVERMEAKALIKRSGDAADRRAHWLAATDRANQLLPELQQAELDTARECFQELTKRDRQDLARILLRLEP
ncbi:MarR family winged helix-turn-helix transcriptional regulator [Aureimonas fodinaquatilis]|uniref:MarR family winged helix-turn-helix transcriptional regulator n=1 Tax=Aureimonas fodinaquatilis TaxID=2565783 RepID=UPI00165DC11B|nr:MarR family transcriptional regulator [Aureimonas fodinaquatilis]